MIEAEWRPSVLNFHHSRASCVLLNLGQVESKTTTCSCQAQQALIQEQSQIIQVRYVSRERVGGASN
jgi:hypothetical protein